MRFVTVTQAVQHLDRIVNAWLAYNSLTHELIKNIDIGYEFEWHGTNSMTAGQLNISPDGKKGFIQVSHGIKILNLE